MPCDSLQHGEESRRPVDYYSRGARWKLEKIANAASRTPGARKTTCRTVASSTRQTASPPMRTSGRASECLAFRIVNHARVAAFRHETNQSSQSNKSQPAEVEASLVIVGPCAYSRTIDVSISVLSERIPKAQAQRRSNDSHHKGSLDITPQKHNLRV